MQSLTEYVSANDALLTVATSDDALFVSSLIAEYGYLQTAEFRHECGGSPARLRRVLSQLIEARIIVHQERPHGVFNGWVVTHAGLEFLASLGLADVDRYCSAISEDTMKMVARTLDAQVRFGNRPPSIETLRSVLQTVPEDRQEWLAFAICYEPMPDDALQSLVDPPSGEAARLLTHSKEELTRLATTKRQTHWPAKPRRRDSKEAEKEKEHVGPTEWKTRKDHIESEQWAALIN